MYYGLRATTANAVRLRGGFATKDSICVLQLGTYPQAPERPAIQVGLE